jgi:hypothetical protein
MAEYWLQLATKNSHWERLSVASCCNHKAIGKYSELSAVSGNGSEVPCWEAQEGRVVIVFCLCASCRPPLLFV